MKFSNERLYQFDDYDVLRRERLNPEEIKEQDKLVKAEVTALREVQDAITREVAKYMVEEKIGINELTRRLHTSSRQTNRIMSGQANITLATLIELASVMGKKPKIIFEPI